MALTLAKTAGVKRYTPTSARSLRGSAGFSTSRTTRPSSSSAMPYDLGSATCCRRMSASGALCSKSRTNGAMPSLRRLSPRYMTNGLSPR